MRPRSVISAVLLLCASCANQSPTAPTVEIFPPAPQTADDLVASVPVASTDEDDDPITYAWAWFQDGVERGDLGSTSSVAAINTAKGEVWRVVATPSDGVDPGPSGEAVVTVLNTPPVATVSVTPGTPATDEALEAIAEGSDEDGDPVSFTYRWLRDGELTSHTDAVLPADQTSKGETWTVEATPDDGEEQGEPVAAAVSIDNGIPEIISVSIGPDPATEADVILASIEASDPDGDALSYHCVWSVDGVAVQEGALASLSGEHFDKHQQVQVVVSPDDGWAEGEAVASNTITIVNTTPSISAVAIDPGTLLEGSTASCTAEGWSDADGDPDGDTWAWSANGLDLGLGDQSIDGASFDRGDSLVCTATPDDGEEQGEALSSDAVTVGNTAPVVTAASLSETSPATDATLSVSASSSDDDGDSVSLGYAWMVDGTLVATSETLDGEHFDRGQAVWVELTPFDGTDYGASFSTALATVANTPPELSSVSLTPTDARTDDTLSVSVTTTDLDGDTVSLSYTWTVDGVVQAASGSSLGGSAFDRDQVVQVEVTPDDGAIEGASALSNAVTIANTAPGAPVISIDPADPADGDDLVCTVDSPASDADGDTVTYGFTWTVDGAGFSGASTTTWAGDTVPASGTAPGELWTCVATPDDGDLQGDTASASATVRMAFTGWPSTTTSVADADYTFYGDPGDLIGGTTNGGGDIDGDGVNDVLIGAQNADGGGADSGGAAVFLAANLGSTTRLPLDDGDWVFLGEAAADYAGAQVVILGDMDGDGLDEIGVGAGSNDSAGSGAGVVHVVLAADLPGGGGVVDLGSSTWRILGEHSGDGLGNLGRGGDVDGDGLGDLLTACRYNDDGGSDAGKSYLFYSSSLGSTASVSASSADVKLVGEDAGDSSGRFVRGDGDIDGDGVSDVAISAWYAADGGSRSGKAYVFLGDSLPHTGTVDLSTADYSFIGEASTNYLSHSINIDGDVDGDGLNDLIFSAYFNDDGGTYAGKSYLFTGASLGSTSGSVSPTRADWMWTGDSAQDQAGTGVGFAGDVDGDGMDDVLIGAKADDRGATDAGTQYLFLSGSLGSGGTASVATADYMFVGDEASAQCGWDVVRWGDISGDGLADVMVPCPYGDDGGTSSGVVYLMFAR